MPYTITTETDSPLDHLGVGPTIVRRAVATLDEARDYVHNAGATFSVAAIGEQGGTVGPLPDGTTITVEQVGWVWLWTSARDAGALIHSTSSKDETIAAYNAI